MRAFEFLIENYDQDLKVNLKSIFLNLKASGVSQIKTEDLVQRLNKMGNSIDVNGLVEILNDQNNGYAGLVLNSTPDVIQLKQDDNMPSGTETSAEKATDIAIKAAKRSK